MNDKMRYVDNPLSIDGQGIGVNLIYMAMEGLLFFMLTLLIEVCTLSALYWKSYTVCTCVHKSCQFGDWRNPTLTTHSNEKPSF